MKSAVELIHSEFNKKLQVNAMKLDMSGYPWWGAVYSNPSPPQRASAYYKKPTTVTPFLRLHNNIIIYFINANDIFLIVQSDSYITHIKCSHTYTKADNLP